MKKSLLKSVCLLSIMFGSPAVVLGQRTVVEFNDWLKQRAQQLSQAEISMRITQRNATKQAEAPSISSNTTSLVDKSSASDLTGIAMNFAGLATNSTDADTTSMAATVSAYALKAAAAKRNPLDPAFYNANRDWRRLSFTVGFDYPEESSASINDRAIIFGLKYLPYDKRDASDSDNRTEVEKISSLLGDLNVQASRLEAAIQEFVRAALKRDNRPNTDGAAFERTYFGPNWGVTYDGLLSPADRQAIDEIITSGIAPFVAFTEGASESVERIRKKPQIAFSFLTKQRREERPDEHALGAIFDLGLARRFNLTLNAGFNYLDNKLLEDNKGGRVGLDLQVQVTRDKLEGRMPLFLSIAGDGCWMTGVVPTYRAQAKLSIPIVQGIDLPLSVSYASRTEFINEDDIKGKFGFTFDIARIAQAFGGGILGRR